MFLFFFQVLEHFGQEENIDCDGQLILNPLPAHIKLNERMARRKNINNDKNDLHPHFIEENNS